MSRTPERWQLLSFPLTFQREQHHSQAKRATDFAALKGVAIVGPFLQAEFLLYMFGDQGGSTPQPAKCGSVPIRVYAFSDSLQ